jgi:hypothetical protein
MAKNNTGNKNGKAAEVAKLIEGARKHFPDGKQKITIGGASTTVDDATNTLQALVSNRADVVAAQATAKAKLDHERAQMPALNAYMHAFIAFVRVTFGTDAPALTDFGVTPPKVKAPMTAEQKVVAAAKRTATRAARGTKGPKAAKAVKGNAMVKVVVTPATATAVEGNPGPSGQPAVIAQTSGTATTQQQK